MNATMLKIPFWSERNPHPSIIFAFYYSTQQLTFQDQLVQLFIRGFLFCAETLVPKTSEHIQFTVPLNPPDIILENTN